MSFVGNNSNGIGEQRDDLVPFHPRTYVDSLFE